MHPHKINFWTPELRAISDSYYALLAKILILQFLQEHFFDGRRESELVFLDARLKNIAQEFKDVHNAHCRPEDVITLADIIPPPTHDPEPPPQEPHP